ncbi:S41 family peptidase [Chryseobacterium oryzae]|uniref:S41 family peptidase n=1 Tax=Chryseobacterium oryzae TaxID=2929799 RepID=A0ABY4BIR3_9FLAO|nr:S41 family peptidase [Chryseobacterium oryzae]UOE39057.1 S41 family peptidase [Chryseobacterium oryzae]
MTSCSSVKNHNEQMLEMISPENLREDVDFTYSKLQQLHPKLYWYISKEQLDFKFDSLKATINKPLNSVQFYFKLQPIIAQIKEGHLSLKIPSRRLSRKEIKTLKNKKGLFGRFEYRIENNHLYFTENKDSIKNIVPGTELLEINNEPVSKYIKKYSALINSDGDNRTFQRYFLSDTFFNFYVAEKGILDSAKIKTLYNKEVKLITLKRDVKNEKELAKEKIDSKRTPEKKVNDYVAFSNSYNRSFRFLDKDSAIAYIKIKSFSGTYSEKFYKQTFSEIKKARSSYLIIDIRDNYGGSLSEINDLYSYLVQQPFVLIKPSQLTSRMSPFRTNYFRKTNPINYTFKTFAYPGFFFHHLLSVYKGKDGISYYKMKESKPTKPKEDCFKGKIYVLINGSSFSASSVFSSKLKNDERAVLVGEETGGANDGTVAGFYSYQKLPHSKIELPIGLLLVQPNINFEEKHRGVFPNFPVIESLQDIIDKKDVQLQWILNKISADKN